MYRSNPRTFVILNLSTRECELISPSIFNIIAHSNYECRQWELSWCYSKCVSFFYKILQLGSAISRWFSSHSSLFFISVSYCVEEMMECTRCSLGSTAIHLWSLDRTPFIPGAWIFVIDDIFSWYQADITRILSTRTQDIMILEIATGEVRGDR